jgi:hypothetical protein
VSIPFGDHMGFLSVLVVVYCDNPRRKTRVRFQEKVCSIKNNLILIRKEKQKNTPPPLNKNIFI